jgi:hypothetical protein
MAINWHFVRRTGEDHIDLVLLEQLFISILISGIDAREPLGSKLPEVANSRNGCFLHRRD